MHYIERGVSGILPANPLLLHCYGVNEYGDQNWQVVKVYGSGLEKLTYNQGWQKVKLYGDG